MGLREGVTGSRRLRRRSLSATGGLAVAFALGCGAPAVEAATQTLQVQASPNAQATLPVSITATGQVGVPATSTIFAQPGGSGCAASAAAEAATGATLVDQRAVAVGAFSFTAMFTPKTAGTYFVCTYLDGSSGGTSEQQDQALTISVAPAPAPPPPPVSTPPAPAPALPGRCIVPSLRRHTLRGAEHLLALGNCKLGRVYRPSAASLRVARKRAHGKPLAEVVVSQTPAAGLVRVGGYTIAVRLGFGPTPRTNPRRPTP